MNKTNPESDSVCFVRKQLFVVVVFVVTAVQTASISTTIEMQTAAETGNNITMQCIGADTDLKLRGHK